MTQPLLYSRTRTWYDLYMTQDTHITYLEQYQPAWTAETITLAASLTEDDS